MSIYKNKKVDMIEVMDVKSANFTNKLELFADSLHNWHHMCCRPIHTLPIPNFFLSIQLASLLFYT